MKKSICVVSPKCSSVSAKLLASLLKCDYHRAEPRYYHGYDIVFNYGSSRIGVDNQKVINLPTAVGICVNKISTLRRVSHGVEWTKNPDMARDWLKHDDYVVCRENEEGSKSAGVSIVSEELFDTTPAKFWTRYFPHDHEVRVNVYKDKILSVYDKQMYTLDGKEYFDFVHMPIEGEHKQVNEMIASIRKNIGIDYYGMDVLVNEEGVARLLEINSGPSLSEETINPLIDEIIKEIQE